MLRGVTAILMGQIGSAAGGAAVLIGGLTGSDRAAWVAAGGALLAVSAGAGILSQWYAARRCARAQVAERSAELRYRLAAAERDHAHAIISSISDAVLVTDGIGQLVLANESAARTFGIELPGGEQNGPAGMAADSSLAGLIREMRQGATPAGRRVVEQPVKTPAGERVFKVTLSCVTAGGAEPAAAQLPAKTGAGVVAVLQDVTHEREVAELKNQFVSSVSHELRTPLASIKAYVEMLVDGEAAEEQTRQRFYDVIHSETNRLTRLIDNMLNISSIESGLMRVNRQALSLDEVLKQAAEIIQPQAKQRGQQLVTRVAAPDARVWADKDMLLQAALNLLSNAVKYTPAGGVITIESTPDAVKRQVTARITDTGVGIPPKDLPFVFDKFYRVEANSHMAKGTGLGLSLVKHILETVHGGRIFVESSVGNGSCFGFELELCDAAVQ